MPRTVPGIKLVLLHGWTNGWVDGRLILTHGSENSGYWLRPWSRLHTTLCPTPTPSTPDSHPAVFFLCFIAMYTFWQQIIDLLVLFIACLSSLEFKPHKGGTFACFAHYHCLMQCREHSSEHVCSMSECDLAHLSFSGAWSNVCLGPFPVQLLLWEVCF